MSKTMQTQQQPAVEIAPAATTQPTITPPGGGSWFWDGAAWQPKIEPAGDSIVEQAAKESPAVP